MKVCKGHRCLVVPIKSDAFTGSIPTEGSSAGVGRRAMRPLILPPAPDTEGQSSAASSSLLVATSSLISSRLVSSGWSGPKRVKSVEDLTPHTLARKRRRVASPLRLPRRLSKPPPRVADCKHRCARQTINRCQAPYYSLDHLDFWSLGFV